jgi:regulator of protease activity HflC (stomatin/prohibitin superfamily)
MSPRDDTTPPPVPWKVRKPGAVMAGSFTAIVLFGLLIFLPIFIWFFCRIEPRSDQIAILIRKTGENLASGEIIATSAEQKGIRLEVLAEGRYFRNPYVWDWRISDVTDIPAGKLGVLTRLFGKDLAPGQIIARDGSKGIVEDVLRPGKHRINPYAYRVELFDAITIKPGSAGVVTSLNGKDVLNGGLGADAPNDFLVEKGVKGVITSVLDPGTYYLNPYVVSVAEVTLQSQRFEMSGEDAISFLTQDGFNVFVEGTLEFAISREKAALLTHRVGDMEDVLRKVILPRARGFSRIEGSKHPAINFIVGETRQQFQNNLETHLRDKCAEWGVAIRSVLIRNIQPPDEIASIIREREVAVQNSIKFDQQIEQAKSQAELVKQEMLAQQSKERIEAETTQKRAILLAQQGQAVQITAANKELEVAKLAADAAQFQAQSILARANADRDVIQLNNEAEAAVIANRVKAFGTGNNYARFVFYQKIGPQIGSILSSDDLTGLGGIFTPYIPGREARP